MEKPKILVTGYAPRPESRTDLIGTIAIDYQALSELVLKLQGQFPEYEVGDYRVAMAGKHPIPIDALQFFLEVDVPWGSFSGPATTVVTTVLKDVITEYWKRRKAPPDPPLSPEFRQPETIEEAVASVPIYGPDGYEVSSVEEMHPLERAKLRRRPGPRREY